MNPWAARAMLGLTMLVTAAPAAGPLVLSGDGWRSWRVAAVDNVGDWCCYDWNSGHASRKTCDLDDHRGGYASAGTAATAPGTMQIYALLEDGEPIRVRTLSAACAVTSASRIDDLGRIEAADSVAWLQRHVAGDTARNAQLLAAIAVHDGVSSRDVLVRFAEQHESRQTRKDALFWLGQLRAEEAIAMIERIAHQDPHGDMRQHAIFVLAQLPNEAGIDSLMALVGNRKVRHDDRKRALFWLAQSNSDRALDFLAGLLAVD